VEIWLETVTGLQFALVAHCELVETLESPDAYYKVTVYRKKDGMHFATIPGMGRVQAAKDMPKYPWQSESFAWKIQGEVTHAHTS